MKILKTVAAVLLAWSALVLMPRNASAGYFELSTGFSYSRSNYGDGGFDWTRRWNASFGYHFNDISEIEIGFQDTISRTLLTGYQDTTTHDQTYSLSWVQSLFGREAIFDPYLRLGVGQLNRIARGTYMSLDGVQVESEVSSLSQLGGVGVRIGVTRRFGIRLEADTYITGWRISTWKDNTSFTAGLTYYF